MSKCSSCGHSSNPAKAKFCSKCGAAIMIVVTKPVETTFENKCQVLSELWLNMRLEPDFKEFIEYNDLGFPLAYVLANDIATPNEKSYGFVNETFNLLLEHLKLEDSGFKELDELLEEWGGYNA